MAAPNLAARNAFYFNYVGTDDAGYNAIGAPWSYRSLPAALAALALVANPPSATNPWIISGGPGVFSVPAGFQLPPWVWITGSPDGEAGGPTILELQGNITLSAAWALNSTARGGLANLVIRPAAGSPRIDFTLPVPSAGNPSRTIEIQNVRHDIDFNFEATGTGDALQVDNMVQDGSLADTISILSGAISLNQLQTIADVTLTSGAVLALAARITASQISQILVTKGAAACGVAFDGISWPLIGNVSLVGGPTLTRLSDANAEGYTPAVPANWPAGTDTVQEALDALAAGGGGNTKTGSTPLVNGQQSYAIVFGTPFGVAPTRIRGWIQMASSTGEIFTVAADMSTATVSGVTLWLGGVPSASVGNLVWEAS